MDYLCSFKKVVRLLIRHASNVYSHWQQLERLLTLPLPGPDELSSPQPLLSRTERKALADNDTSTRRVQHFTMVKPGAALSNPLDFKSKSAESVLMELSIAESNLRAIRNAATDLATNSLLAKYCGGLDINPLRELIVYLRAVYACIRAKVYKDKPGLRSMMTNAVETGAKLPQTDVTIFESLCPMTLFLQIVARGLSTLRVSVTSNDWGGIEPLRRKLEKLQSHLERYDSKLAGHAALAKCIMFHEEHGVFTVVGTTPTYYFCRGLEKLARDVRYEHINSLTATVDKKTLQCVTEKLQLTSIKINEYQEHEKSDPSMAKFDQREAVAISGGGATFDSTARYKIACIADFCRFRMDRFQAGNTAEARATLLDRRPAGDRSCAEWELWRVKLTTPPVLPKSEPRYRSKVPGTPRAGTYPGPPRRPAPAALRHATKTTERPSRTHLPEYQNQDWNPRKVSRADSWEHTLYPYKQESAPKHPVKKTKPRGYCAW